MKVKIKSLADIDPLQVPLPYGTEVTTRVDRQAEGRLVKQGAIGRVKAMEGSAITVSIVGVGAVVYSRDELTPRKLGQLNYALHRESAWKALRANVVIETVVGSRAWGLADENSDTDRRGLYVLPFPWTTALVDAPTDLVSADGSENFWEVGKAFRQAIRADPNTLEMLLLTGASACDPMGEWILEAREAFVSDAIYGSFGRYAIAQLRRLEQGMRLAEHRQLLMKWISEDAELTLDQAAAKLADSAKIQGNHQADKELQAKEYIKQLYTSMFGQGLLGARNYASLVTFARSAEHDFELPRELRPKNAYNLLRLLATATQWIRSGTPDFEVKGALRTELLAIKRKEVELSKVISRAEEFAADLEDARSSSKLPPHPDVGRIDELLRRVRAESSRRYQDQVQGPFGLDAAKLPLAEWD